MIAAENGWEREFITNTNRSVDAATQISDNVFHVDGWYTTRSSGDRRIRYQLIAENREFQSGTRTLLRCFVTYDEIDAGESPCF